MITALSLAGILLLAMNDQVFPSILTRLGGTSIQEGLLLAALFLFFPMGSMVAGAVSDRLGKRIVVAAGFLVMALPFTLSAVLPDIRARTLAVLLFGFGGGVVESQISALLSDLNPNRERAVINLSQTMFCLGAAGGPFLIGLIAAASRTSTLAPLMVGAAALNALLFATFVLAPLPRPKTHPPSAVPVPPPAPPSSEASQLRVAHPRPLLREPFLWALAAAIFLYVAAEMGTAGWLAKYGETELGLRRSLAPLCLSVFWGGLGVSRTLMGVMSVSWSDRGVLVGSLTLGLLGQILAFSSRSLALSLIGIALAGFGMGAVWPTLVALAAARFRRASGAAVGVVVAAGALAVPIVQSLVGLLSRPQLLGLRYSLLSLSVLTLLDLVLVLLVLRRPRPALRAGLEPPRA